MNEPKHLKAIQRYVANIGISGSSLRNQGASGVVDAARLFLADLDLTPFNTLDPSGYPAWLDKTTGDLVSQFPEGARKWGAARKAINIFMTQSAFNRELAAAYDLVRFGEVLETPLDKVAAGELRQMVGGENLPRWQGVGKLTKEMSRTYQEFALEVAKLKGVPRGCLDVFLWRPTTE